MGMFSRTTPALPHRADLDAALAGLHPNDAEKIRRSHHLADACGELPSSATIVALLPAVIDSPADRGLLCATAVELIFLGERHGQIKLPLDSVYQVGLIHRGNTLMVAFGAKEAHFGVSFNKKESLAWFIDRLQAAVDEAKQGVSPAAAAPSAADELAKFAALHAQGVLTDAEFAAKKAHLLAQG
jgi:hypothetical protein